MDKIIDVMTVKSIHYRCRTCPGDWTDGYARYLEKHPDANDHRQIQYVEMWFHPLKSIFGDEDAVCRYHIKQKMDQQTFNICTEYLNRRVKYVYE